MKLLRLPKQRAPEVDDVVAREHEERLLDAEKRANVLIETAEWIRTAVAKRDEKNSWQASVNQLFLGESS
jgi:hypothetical protein